MHKRLQEIDRLMIRAAVHQATRWPDMNSKLSEIKSITEDQFPYIGEKASMIIHEISCLSTSRPAKILSFGNITIIMLTKIWERTVSSAVPPENIPDDVYHILNFKKNSIYVSNKQAW